MREIQRWKDGIGHWFAERLGYAYPTEQDAYREVLQQVSEMATPADVPTPIADQVPISDPRSPALARRLEELFHRITFRRLEPGALNTSVVFLLPGDLTSSRTITRLVPGTRVPNFRVDTVIDCVPQTHRGSFYLDAAREVIPSTLRRNTGLQIEVKQRPMPEGSNTGEDYYTTVNFNRTYRNPNVRYGGVEDLSGRTDVKPGLVLRDMTIAIGRLRQEFEREQAESAEALLNPRLRGLVNAIREKAMTLRQPTEGREFPDEFVLIGISDSEKGGILQLDLGFSTDPKVKGASGRWVGEILDNMPVTWEYRGSQMEGTTHAFFAETESSKMNSGTYEANGEVTIERRSARHKVTMDRIPMYMSQIESGAGECCAGYIVGKLFRDHLSQRAGLSSSFTKHQVLLATSIPITPAIAS